MDATENFSPLLHAVPDDPAVAVRANWRKRMDRALEAVKGVVLIGNDYLKRLVIFIFANFALAIHKLFARRRLCGGVRLMESRDEAGKVIVCSGVGS